MDSNFDNEEVKDFFRNEIVCINQLLDMVQNSFRKLLPLENLGDNDLNIIVENIRLLKIIKETLKVLQ